MMSAYVIAFVDIEDDERYKREYVPRINSTLRRFGGKILVSTVELLVKEDAWPEGRVVVIMFESADSAQDWYSSEEYMPLIVLRKEIASSQLAIVRGL